MVVNGRRLNAIQRYFFDKESSTIDFILATLHITLMVFLGYLSFYMVHSKQTVYSLLPVFTILLIYITIAPTFKKKHIFKKISWTGDNKSKYLINRINKSWIINKEMIERAITNPYNHKLDNEVYKFLKNSYGHPIFNQIRKRYVVQEPSMFQYYEKPTKKEVANFMHESYKADKGYMIAKPFTFDVYEKARLIKYYAQLKSINLSSEFNKKALNSMSKEELVRVLDGELVKNKT